MIAHASNICMMPMNACKGVYGLRKSCRRFATPCITYTFCHPILFAAFIKFYSPPFVITAYKERVWQNPGRMGKFLAASPLSESHFFQKLL